MTNPTSERTLVTTIVPAFNEEGNIVEFCRQFDLMCRESGFDNELLFVDDGSTDATAERIVECQEKYQFVRVATHTINRGLTEALQTGFAAANGEIFVFYPADLQFLPGDIPSLVDPILNGADVCTGWKRGDYEKQWVSGVYNWLCRRAFRIQVHDMNSCKAFRRRVVQDMFLREGWHRYIVPLAAARGYRIEEVVIDLHERASGESKFARRSRVVPAFLDFVAVLFQIRFLRHPLRLFGFWGILLIGFGILVGLFAVYLRFVMEAGNRAFLYLVILLVGLGMALFMMGFISEGQTAIKEELSDLRAKIRRLQSKDEA